MLLLHVYLIGVELFLDIRLPLTYVFVPLGFKPLNSSGVLILSIIF